MALGESGSGSDRLYLVEQGVHRALTAPRLAGGRFDLAVKRRNLLVHPRSSGFDPSVDLLELEAHLHELDRSEPMPS